MTCTRKFLLSGACALAATTSAWAQTTPADVVELAPFNVTAEGALSVLQITSRDLEQRQANNLADTLSLDPTITVGGSTGIAQKIYVRNLGEGLLNISVDGATQSGSLFHHIGRVALEPDLLKQVEVQPGVGNASDGPGTLGGAIRFVTKDPDDLLAPGQRAGALLKYGYFSNTRGYKGSATGFARLNDDWSSLVSVVYSEHEEIEDGDGNRLPGSDTRQQVILGKLTGQFGDGHSLRLSFENLDEEGHKLRRPEWEPSPINPTMFMESHRRTATLGYDVNPSTVDWLNLNSTLSYTDADIRQIGPWGPWNGAIQSLQLTLQNTQDIASHQLLYGFDYREDEVTAGPDGNTADYAEDSSVWGLFIEDKIILTEQLRLNLGARYDSYRLDDQRGQSFDHDGFSPSAALTYQVNDALGITASAATALRGPDINDAFKVDIAVNDPDLDAEKAQNYELRFHYQAEGLLLEAGAYANRIQDVITNTLPWSRVYTNAGDLETDGLFARASYATKTAYFSLQYNHADTTLDGQTATRYQYGSLVSRIGDTWVADITWRPLPELDLGWNGRVVQGLDNISVPVDITGVPGGTIDKPGYAVHDFYARWRPSQVEGVTVVLTVKNAFDKFYRSHGSVEDMTAFPGFGGVVGAAEPGRGIRLSVSLAF
jgi:hemoglobin/transferrin/lactoferrin receptor protein